MKILDQTFNNITFEQQMLSRYGYDNCEFIDCTFSNADFADVSFIECSFTLCNFSLARLHSAALKDVQFNECHLLGVDFSVCTQFLWKAGFINCNLDLSLWTGMNLKSSRFENCSMKEADFTKSDLTLASFDQCNLERAIFSNTNLEKTDFRNAFNYSFDPSANMLKKTRFSSAGVKGLLAPFDIIVSE